jgi:hypothetical protein
LPEKKICRNCKYAIVETSKNDLAMAKLGYKSCAKARTPEERGRYIKGDTECVYPERMK